MSDTNYRAEATDDALGLIREYEDEIADYFEGGSGRYVEGDLLELMDRGLWEGVTDRSYSLSEGAEVLHQLSDHVETDWGLWEGKDADDAIGIQAAFTYRNAVVAELSDLIKSIEEACEQVDDDFAERNAEAAEAYAERQAEADEDDDEDEPEDESPGHDDYLRAVREAIGDPHLTEGICSECGQQHSDLRPDHWMPARLVCSACAYRLDHMAEAYQRGAEAAEKAARQCDFVTAIREAGDLGTAVEYLRREGRWIL